MISTKAPSLNLKKTSITFVIQYENTSLTTDGTKVYTKICASGLKTDLRLKS